MILIAHRGLTNENIKENTLEAYVNALNNGFSGIEIDIRKTKDNKIVCIHDKLINRTSNGKGNINNLTYKELLKYNFGTKNKKSNIPLLKEVVKKINNSILIIELKEEFNCNELEEILSNNKTNDYYICSFYKKYIDKIKELKHKKGIINYVFNSYINKKDYDFIMILEDLFNKNIYNYLKNNNIESIIYNVSKNLNIKNKELLTKIKYII